MERWNDTGLEEQLRYLFFAPHSLSAALEELKSQLRLNYSASI